MLASEEAVYEDPGQKAPIRFMASGGDSVMPEILLIGWIRNTLHFLDRLAQRIPNGIPRTCV